MKRWAINIELLEDCILGARAATAGGHRGLDYIPGSALLGMAAAQIYRGPKKAQAFTLLHSGKVRFGWGLPLAPSGSQAYPVPLTWQRVKGDPYVNPGTGNLDAGRIYCALQDIPQGSQPKQLRSGYVTIAGEYVHPPRNFHLKTAIDPTTGRAADAQLFGYDAIAAGSRFSATLMVDDDVDSNAVKALLNALEGERLLGRSKAAQFGRVLVSIEKIDVAPPVDTSKSTLTLWLMSDLAAFDVFGQPTFAPSLADLGLGKGELDAANSSIRSRRYSTWNAHRGGHDQERFVICAGSVLRYAADGLESDAAARLQRGLGGYLELGLGQVWVNPPFLDGQHPTFSSFVGHANFGAPTKAPVTMTDLVKHLASRHDKQAAMRQMADVVEALLDEYVTVCEAVCVAAGLPKDTQVGPSFSQWGNVGVEARKASDAGDLAKRLFGEDHGTCRPTAAGWGDAYFDAHARKRRTLSDWFDATLKRHNQADRAGIALRLSKRVRALKEGALA
ncbi:MAG: hypothetical protein AB8G17_16195 [Gammaproteobacteria bacterium]